MAVKTIDYDFFFKFVMVGDPGAGKSTLLTYYVDKELRNTYISTIGVDFKVRTADIDGNKLKFQIWDLAGQARFRAIISAYYRGTDGVLLVYNTTRRDSFEHLPDWLNEIRRYTTKFVLVGTECGQTNRAVTEAEGQAWADSHGMPFFEVSCRHDVNVDAPFMTLARIRLEEIMSRYRPTSPSNKRCANCEAPSEAKCKCNERRDIARRAPDTIRQWCRLVNNPDPAQATGPTKELLRFFVNFPGLKRFVGGRIVLYYNPLSEWERDNEKNGKCLMM